MAVLQELIRRKVIKRTLADRKETEVCSLLRFLGRNFTDLNWQPVLIRVLGQVFNQNFTFSVIIALFLNIDFIPKKIL